MKQKQKQTQKLKLKQKQMLNKYRNEYIIKGIEQAWCWKIDFFFSFIFFFFFFFFFGVPHLASFIFFFIKYVIASIAYIHPVYGGIRTHDLLDVSLLP